ncbi:MAG: V-type ATP synthase subunit I [Candidatus Atribacteria bacterium]
MAVCKVKKVNLFTHIELKDKIIEELQQAGCIQITNVTAKLEKPDLLTYKEIKTSEIDSALSKVKYCIDYLSNYKDKTIKIDKSLVWSRNVYDCDKLSILFAQFDYKNIYRKCKELDGALSELKSRENHIEGIKDQLIEWKELNVKIQDLEGTKNTKLILGFIALKDYISCLEEIKNIGKEIDIKKFGENKKQCKIMIISIPEYHLSIKKILSKYNFEYFKFPPELKGTPLEVIKNISKELKDIRKNRGKIAKASIKLYKNNLSLYIAFDHLFISKNRKDIEKYFKQTKNVLILEGWILEKDIDSLKKRLFKKYQEIEIFFSDPKESEDIPIALNNNKMIKPFEVITELYGIPRYKEFDPTPLLMPFFFIFFGMCLSDAGYGLIMAGLFYFAARKFKAEGMAKKLFNLLILGGLSSFVVGVFMGSWLGNTLDFLPNQIIFIRNILLDKVALINPINNPMPILILSLILGLIQIYTGIITKFIANIKNKKLVDGLMDQGSWLLLLTGFLIFGIANIFSLSKLILSLSKYMIIGGFLSIVFSQGRTNKNIAKRIGIGILALYNIIGYLSDVLSYSRLFALGLATGIIAVVINTLVLLVKDVPYIGFILVILVYFGGHLFNIAISTLSAFIHSARLQYVEFFTKFYQGGGTAFIPFKVETKYVKINIKE